jgi:hypothetical protein
LAHPQVLTLHIRKDCLAEHLYPRFFTDASGSAKPRTFHVYGPDFIRFATMGRL